MKTIRQSRRRTPGELFAACTRNLLRRYRGQHPASVYARTVERNFFRPLDQLEAEQNRAIAAIVDHAYHHSPFYRERFAAAGFKPGDVKNRADLAHLPRVSKSELAANVNNIRTAPADTLHHASTGGTTGIALNFYRDTHCLMFRRGIDLATMRYYGWRDGQWQGWLWGASADLVSPTGVKAHLLRTFGDRMFYFNALQVTADSYRSFIEQIHRYRPTYLSAYPTIADDLAQRILAGQIPPFRVPLISLTAEPVYDFQRQHIRDAFADQVYERYGSREFGMAALECPEHSGLHYFTESVCFEAVQHDPAAPGQSLIVTDLLNYGMPLIRYQTGDFADLDSAPCPCGRTTPRIKNIKGRELDVIWCPDGHGVAGFMIVTMVARGGINAPVQVVQHSLDQITVRIEGHTPDRGAHALRLLDIFHREISPQINFQLEWVDRIERAPSGKYRYVISNVKRPVSA